MASHHGRLYALAISLVVFFLAWTVVAAHPWVPATADPRARALAARETQLRREAKLVQHVVAARWHAYRVQLKLRRTAIARATATAAAPAVPAAAAAPGVRVVTLPPHVITRTS